MYARQVYFALDGFSLSSGDVVLDLGANCGLFTALAAKIGCRTVAVDVQQDLLDQISPILRRNHCESSVSLVWGVVGAGSGLVAVREDLTRSAPPSISLTELLSRFALDRVDFLKVDIEGSEFGLFNGSLDWLGSVRRIAMEVHKRFGDPLKLAGVMRHHGFEVHLVENGIITREIRADTGYLFATNRKNVCSAPQTYICGSVDSCNTA